MLTKLQMKILRHLNHKPITYAEIRRKYNLGDKDSLEHIRVLNEAFTSMIDYPGKLTDDTLISLNHDGQAVVDANNAERRRFWLPIIISTAITIPGAYREEWAQLGRALLKLLKLLTAN